jgi:ArsR family transcriptional regulator
MKSVKKNEFHGVEFKTGMRFEFFYALSSLTDSNSKYHKQWKEKSWAKLPKKFHANCEKLGSSSLLWPIFSTLVPTLAPDCSYRELAKSIEEINLTFFQKKVLDGFIHDEEQVKRCLDKKLNLQELISHSKNEKREWLIHVGLYPYSESSELVQSLEFLISNPSKFRKTIIETMDLFWKHCFESTWSLIEKPLQKSMLELQSHYNDSESLADIFEKTNLRAIYNESKNEITALRGGYSVKTKDIKKCYFIPSVFNHLGWWSSLDDKDGEKMVFFPYFDPSINVDLTVVNHKNQSKVNDLDPFLIFKSLGDPTRFAIIKMISDKPMSASSIAQKLGLTKATVSHHVSLLRQSGLLHEDYSDGQVFLSVNQRTIEKISNVTCDYLKLSNQSEEKSYGKSI